MAFTNSNLVLQFFLISKDLGYLTNKILSSCKALAALKRYRQGNRFYKKISQAKNIVLYILYNKLLQNSKVFKFHYSIYLKVQVEIIKQIFLNP